MPVRVLFLHSNLLLGGAETLRLAQLRYADRSLLEPHVAVRTLLVDGKEPWVAQELRQLGVPVYDLECPASPVLRPQALLKLAFLLRRVRPDILQTSMFDANTVGRIVALAYPHLKVISEEHNRYVWKRTVHRAFDHVLAYRSNRIVACSRAVAEHAATTARIEPARFRTIPNCLDVSRFQAKRTRSEVRRALGTPDDAFVIAGVGRISEQKGFERLVAAFAKLTRTPAPRELWIIGGDAGNARAELEKVIAQLPPEVGRVRLLGERHDVADFLGAADAFGHAARWEGFGVVLLEAMHLGLPVVAFAVDGVPDVVHDGVTGTLVPPNDIPGLARALDELGASPEKRAAYGVAAKERVAREFSPVRYNAEMMALYREVLAS